VKHPETITEAIEQLETVGKYYLDRLYPESARPKLARKGQLLEDGIGQDEDDDDPFCIEIEGWLKIVPFETTEKYKCIGCERERKVIHYRLQEVVWTSGVYRYSDGSGEPDSSELCTVKTLVPLTYAIIAIEEACKYLYEKELNAIGESFCEDQMVEEELEEITNFN
jgi:hypothetical protein